ncbi:MBL fold metallo-hydrolase [Pseudoduganella namucuonensis]|uniref:Phosphoribosyl 1,2-cyclic phosphodiesterase n=1 Tax=Pseudoduganella namucuonensis TaxID=1035707 RepID=A0A1I7IVX3_9BURK|nr:MBL fold metallo-hydrolase [Pseudoduganella namucuonensis]SFU77021.1 Phosphoribosyl 1,2-cyclic phosphodiesterase [Pseudoduganella namucuonensis]
MKFKFWGVRGSIPSPGPRTARYGGNTTCIEVRSDDDTLIVIDGGTGIFALAQSLIAQKKVPVKANIFITHSHWDHIHGLPFFTPLFIKGSRVRLHGTTDPDTGNGIEHVMGVQLQNSYFPVSETQMDATIEYRTLAPAETIAVGDAQVSNVVMNHPVIDLGYRIDCNGKSVFFTGDHEPHYNIYPPGHPEHAAFQSHIEERTRAIEATIQGVTALIVDCSYTREEYPAKQGWGHGTFDGAFAMAIKAGAKQLYCTHHEPTRSDDELEAVFQEVMARHAPLPEGLQVFLAYEGLEVEL